MYKLLALDIDDTLLDSKRRLSKANHDAILKARAAGVTVTICTGRMYRSSTQIMKMLEIEGPVINYGGAQVTHFPSGRILYMDALPMPLVYEVISFAYECGVFIQCYDNDDFYFDKPTVYSDRYAEKMGFGGIQADLMTFPFENIPKLLIIAEPARIAQLLPLARERFGERLNITISSPTFLEFNTLTSSKGTALKALAESMGVAREEVIAMGDTLIDKPMIEYAGLGVCVANGEEETKAAADYIAPDCDHDAVAHVINRFILNI